ncbi:nucleoside deaminase [Haliscomenobacter hydrossis]|uniref:CMP/dCMP deaminase zinc-binding protein n=1 Tax=Haliscomenobacter hydrossis (strain ATCC 27775 / DSM 1100 / LMG 10767 / O) TaxID=760192 RepID=F4KVQ4_HALH1|nr:nucleoside deaminase [Haliscomenobacter hydrossis]AEE52511.1 CMP/dCMP deaminase zinc-binding protein [Haliscomenobacter hydrossis DSM 1100]
MLNSSLHPFFLRCHELAATSAELGNPPVGAVLIRDGLIIAEGLELARSSGDVTRHAEIEAIRAAVHILKTSDLSDCELITTHEPCVMCAYAIRHYRIRRVVYELAVPTVGGVSSKFPVLSDPTFWEARPVPEIHLGF